MTQPIQYLQQLPVNSVREAITEKSPSIALIRKKAGDVVVKALLVKILGNVVQFFNVGKSMDSNQLAELTGLILEDYYFLKMADMKVWANGFKKGKFLKFSGDKLFDRLDGQIIMLSIGEYCESRVKEAEAIQRESESNLKALNAGGEKYLVKAGEKYLRDTGNRVIGEVKEKELATAFTWDEAMEVKRLFEGAKIVNANKDGTLFDYLRKHKPELAAELEAVKEPVKNNYEVERARIMANTALSEFERENKVRGLSGLLPLTESEFEERNKAKK